MIYVDLAAFPPAKGQHSRPFPTDEKTPPDLESEGVLAGNSRMGGAYVSGQGAMYSTGAGRMYPVSANELLSV